MSRPPLHGDDEASTPLTPEERDALIPSYITQRRELNEAEQIGIDAADRWAFTRRRDVLNVPFLSRLHKRMFGGVWSWAGAYSKEANRRIGLDHWQIEPALHTLVDDARYWTLHESYAPDEIALRFHHRLVSIHPFPNGNGRHARLAADLLAVRMGRPRFTWGRADLVTIADTRRRYVEALRAADGMVIEPLLAFARA